MRQAGHKPGRKGEHMNAARRKTIRGIIEKLEAIKADIEEAKEAVDDVAAEEREAFDNMPEGAQASDRGQQMEENADALETAAYDLDIDIDSIIEALEEVIG